MKRQKEQEQSLMLIVMDYLQQLAAEVTDEEQLLKYSAMSAGMTPDDFLDAVNLTRGRSSYPV